MSWLRGLQSRLCFGSQAWWFQKTFLGLALVVKISICKIILCRCRSSYGHVIWAASADPDTVPRCAEDPHAEDTIFTLQLLYKSAITDPSIAKCSSPIRLYLLLEFFLLTSVLITDFTMLWQFAKDLMNLHGFWMDSVAVTSKRFESLAATGVPIGAVELICIRSWSEFDHFLKKDL